MVHRFMTAVAIVLVAAVAACDDAPTESPASLDEAALTEASLGADHFGPYSSDGHGPKGRAYMARLVREAVETVREAEGDEAAKELIAELRRLHEEAFAARRAGDRDLFLERMAAAHEEAARIVVGVLGTEPARAAVEDAAGMLEELQARIAALEAEGKDPERLRTLYERADAHYQVAVQAWAAGDAVEALDEAARAIQMLRFAPHARRDGEGHGGPGRH